MDKRSITSAQNGKKGGRKPGTNQVALEKAKAQLIKDYLERIKPINKALLDKAESGDIQAIRELHDRVYGKAAQPITGDKDNPLTVQVTGMKIVKE